MLPIHRGASTHKPSWNARQSHQQRVLGLISLLSARTESKHVMQDSNMHMGDMHMGVCLHRACVVEMSDAGGTPAGWGQSLQEAAHHHRLLPHCTDC